MSSNLVQVTVALTKVTANLPSSNAPYSNTSVVVTDSSGVPQTAVVLNGSETPTPWAFTTSVATGAGTVVATDVDANGATIGNPVSQSFTEVGTPPIPTFLQTTGIAVTPVSNSLSSAASAVSGRVAK